jgi:protein-tyrosine phosphatase
MGVSRSATFVLAFLMKDLRIKYEEAFKLVNEKRPISPNKEFRLALLEYEKIILG